MSPLQTFVRYELKRLMANVCRMYPENERPDRLAVVLTVINQIKQMELAEVQPEDERKTG